MGPLVWCPQPPICHVGIHVLQAFAASQQYPYLKDASCRIIKNVSKHPRNRTLIYASELSQKARGFLGQGKAGVSGGAWRMSEPGPGRDETREGGVGGGGRARLLSPWCRGRRISKTMCALLVV